MNEISNGTKLIVGLGNPGEKYKNNRHNAGFLALDWIVANLRFKIEDFRFNNKFDALILEANLDHSDVIQGFGSVLFIKPQTFMNNSGKTVRDIVNFYKIDASRDLLILHDDVDLPLGTIRANGSSSSAGHKGAQNVIDELGTQNFHRIRIGVESRTDKNIPPTEAFVLQNFSDKEIKKLQADIFPAVKLEIEKFIINKS